MKKLITVLVFLIVGLSYGQKQQEEFSYNYSVDLSTIKDDKLRVRLQIQNNVQDELIFRMPKIIPGTYEVYDFGRFISDFNAIDKNGNPLKVTREDINSWKIVDAKNLQEITYLTEDTWDSSVEGPAIFEPAGTSFEKDLYLLNTHTIFGYTDGHKQAPFNIEIKHPSQCYGSTGMSTIRAGKTVDVVQSASYMDLTDSPIMYSIPDTVILKIGNADVLVTVVSPRGLVKASTVAEEIKTTLEAQRKYLGGKLPVDKYAFLIYLFGANEGGAGVGALEHSYSSVYFLPEMPGKQLTNLIVETAAHEFFHIVTPLGIHSHEIHDFNYMKDVMSKHLWLYEGVVEYFAHHVLAVNGLTDHAEYLEKVEGQLSEARRYRSDISFTEMSAGCTQAYKDEYMNVYQKGAVIGLSLDIELLRNSGGKYNLRNLIADLAAKYGKERAFHDDSLFKVIGELTNPQVVTFLESYVAGTEDLPLKETFAAVGVNYEFKAGKPDVGLGGIGLGMNPESGRLLVADLSSVNEFGMKMGYKVGDELISVNGMELKVENVMNVLDDYKVTTKPGDKVVVEIKRVENGEGKVMKLKGKAMAVKSKPKATLSLNPEAPAAAVALRKKWLSAD